MNTNIKESILTEIIENPTISQNKLATKFNISQSSINRYLQQLGYKKINGAYAFVGNDFSELQFNALKYLVSICPIKIQSSVRYLCRDILSDSLPKIHQYSSTISVDESHKNSIYSLLLELGLFEFTSTQVGYGSISFYFSSIEECSLFNTIVEKLSNPTMPLLHYDKKNFLSEIYK